MLLPRQNPIADVSPCKNPYTKNRLSIHYTALRYIPFIPNGEMPVKYSRFLRVAKVAPLAALTLFLTGCGQPTDERSEERRCRERVCRYGWISVGAVTLKKKKK